MSNFDDLLDFNRRMNKPSPVLPALLSPQIAAQRVVYMLEELAEFNKSNCEQDLPGAADSLVDLVYFALGTAVMMGLPWEKIWHVVHKANMSKFTGTDKYGVSGIIKPFGWVSPRNDIRSLLQGDEQ